MRRLLAALTAVTMPLSIALFAPATAQAAPVVTNGIAWTTNEHAPGFMQWFKPSGDYCTMSVVGTDDLGNKVGISAAHCISHEPDGTTVRRWTPWNRYREPIGEIAYRNSALDYVVIDLYDDVILSSNGPGLRLDHLGPANPTGVVCKDGQTTGVTCGVVTRQTDTHIYNLAFMGPGDSGGPLMQGDGWVGINRAMTDYGFEYVKASAVLADIASRQGFAPVVGTGFTVTSN